MISIIAAVAKNNVIGKKNTLPWYIPEDLQRFKELTYGKTVVMGQRTFDSIVSRNGKPLANRTNVVLTKDKDAKFAPGVVVLNDIKDIYKLPDEQIFVIGGGEIFRQTIDSADRLHITHVDQEIDGGDVFFPNIDPEKWKKVSDEPHGNFSFATYERI
ncbi:MAG: dihydrofolate reductase [Acidobacteriaceae bacterium]